MLNLAPGAVSRATSAQKPSLSECLDCPCEFRAGVAGVVFGTRLINTSLAVLGYTTPGMDLSMIGLSQMKRQQVGTKLQLSKHCARLFGRCAWNARYLKDKLIGKASDHVALLTAWGPKAPCLNVLEGSTCGLLAGHR